MRPCATIALYLTLSAALPGALAAPMYKCVSPAGKISYSTHECDGKQRQAKEFQVADPSRETEQERAARLTSESEKLRQANDAFSQRQHERDRAYANEQSAAAANAQATADASGEEVANAQSTAVAADQAVADAQATSAAAQEQARRSAAQAAETRQAEIDRAANERGRMARQFYCNTNPGRC